MGRHCSQDRDFERTSAKHGDSSSSAVDDVGTPYSASLHRVYASDRRRDGLEFFHRGIFSSGGREESGIAARARPICHLRGAALKIRLWPGAGGSTSGTDPPEAEAKDPTSVMQA